MNSDNLQYSETQTQNNTNDQSNNHYQQINLQDEQKANVNYEISTLSLYVISTKLFNLKELIKISF